MSRNCCGSSSRKPTGLAEHLGQGLPDILRQVFQILDEASIPHMLTGSLAAAYYAVPRATRDVDLVVEASESQLRQVGDRLLDLGFYVSSEAIAEAVRFEGQFNVIDPRTGWKVDVILRKNRAFSRTEFGRKVSARLLGVELAVASPEDLVVAKLEWSKRGGSELQLRDVAAILESMGKDLDREYVEKWVAELELEKQWDAVVRDGGGERLDRPST